MKKSSSPKKNYFEVRIFTPTQLSDSISNFLTELGSTGVVFKEVKNKISVTGYLQENSSHRIKFKRLENYLAQLKQIFPEFSTPQLQIRKVKPVDWSKNWRKNFKPILIGKNILVKPSWVKRNSLKE